MCTVLWQKLRSLLLLLLLLLWLLLVSCASAGHCSNAAAYICSSTELGSHPSSTCLFAAKLHRTASPVPYCRVYLDERLNRDGAFTDSLEADAAELKLLMGLGNKEAAEIEATVKQAAYQ